MSRRRRDRLSAGRYVVEGAVAAKEVLARYNGSVRQVFVAADESVPANVATGVPVRHVTRDLLDGALDLAGGAAIALIVDRPEPGMQEGFGDSESPFWIALDGVSDPGNVGAVIRSAVASASRVFIGSGCADPYGPKAIRAAVGLTGPDHVVEIELASVLRTAREGGMRILIAEAMPLVTWPIVNLSGRTVVVFGHETRGVSTDVAALADVSVSVPLANGVESLNVAMAATVLAFEAARQRQALHQ